MGGKLEPGDLIPKFPEGFYELVAYLGTSLLFSFAVIAVLGCSSQVWMFISGLDAGQGTLLIIFYLAVAFVWGQLGSALSHFIIKRPLQKLVRGRLKTRFDYSYDGTENKSSIQLPGLSGFWPDLYVIHAKVPNLAATLMKRYAKCKLARINALSALFITILSLITENWLWCLGGVGLCALFSFEYLHRQCWMNDHVKIAVQQSIGPQRPS